MIILRWVWRLGLAILVLGGAHIAPARAAEAVTGIVTDEEGRPIEGVTGEVCGVEHKLPDGKWDRNHTPHCLMPRVSIAKAGRFTVPFDEKDIRMNLWFEKEGFAPAFVGGISPQPQELKVIMKRGIQVAGQVNHLVKGKLEPVKGVAVYFGCSAGDAAHHKLVYDDPYFFVRKMEKGDDLPYLRRVVTGSFGEYVVQLSPPPKDKQWFIVCLNEIKPLDVKVGRATKGPDFVVQAQVREKGEQDAIPNNNK